MKLSCVVLAQLWSDIFPETLRILITLWKIRFTFLYHTGTLKILSLTPEKWLIHFNAIIRNWTDNTYPQWKLLCSSEENVQRALVETSESSCHVILRCVCFWCSVSAGWEEQDLIYARGRGKHKSVGQQHGLRQQWGLKHPKDHLGWKGEQSGGETWAALACVPQDVVEMLQTSSLFAVLEKVNRMSSAALNWCVSEGLLRCLGWWEMQQGAATKKPTPNRLLLG